jgi:aspartyl-tRNA(Asn)/glutamyl-tRNA(Gln) amidotransferase subunit A
VGVKPSAGRIPNFPSLDFWGASGTSGPLARTVRDCALLLQAMAGPDPRDPLSIDAAPDDYLAACDGDLKGLRVAWSADLGYAPVEPAVRALFEAAVRRFADTGCLLEQHDPGWADPAPWHKVAAMVGAAAHWVDMAAEHPDWVEPSMMWQILSGTKASAIEVARARWERSKFYTQVHRFFEQYDLLLTPMMPVTAWSVIPDSEPTVIDGRPTPTIVDRVPFSYIFNQTGHPAVSVPCGFTADGLPVGLQIVGRWHADSTVLRAAACFEALQPWAQHRPQSVD